VLLSTPSGARNQPHARCVTPRQNPEAIMLDFVNPTGAGGRGLRGRRQARSIIPKLGRVRSRNDIATADIKGGRGQCKRSYNAKFTAMSALPPKTDIAESDRDVRYVPKADIAWLPELLQKP
jgi:hypothetical protein